MTGDTVSVKTKNLKQDTNNNQPDRNMDLVLIRQLH